MGLEAATFIHQLNPANPVGAVDPKAQGDDHIRMIKATLQATFPNITGAVTVTLAQLNQWAGLAGNYNWSGQHRHLDGVVGAPAFSFVSDTNSGMYSNGADQLGFATAGVLRFNVSTTEIVSRLKVLSIDGTVGAPSYSFESDTNTGMYRHGAGQIGFVAGGVTGLRVHSTFVYAPVQMIGADGTVGAPQYAFNADLDTGMYRENPNEVRFAAGGVLSFLYDTVRFRPVLPVQGVDGVVGTPSYSFINDQDTGIYLSSTGVMQLAAGGVNALSITDPGATGMPVRIAVGQFGAADGTVGAPAISFVSDPNTGIYKFGSDVLGFSEGGTGYRVGFRSVPRSTTATTLAITDIGKCVAVSAAINIPASVFSAGDCLSIYNDSAASVNITTSAGTLRLAGTTTTGTRTLAARGMATLWFNVGGATPEVIASGPGVS